MEEHETREIASFDEWRALAERFQRDMFKADADGNVVIEVAVTIVNPYKVGVLYEDGHMVTYTHHEPYRRLPDV